MSILIVQSTVFFNVGCCFFSVLNRATFFSTYKLSLENMANNDRISVGMENVSEGVSHEHGPDAEAGHATLKTLACG